MKIAVLSIGMIGFPMGRRLCEAGHTVHAWNRTLHNAQRLASFGAVVHSKPDDAVCGADIVITMLDNGPVVHDILFDMGVADAMPASGLVIDMSSIKPVKARDHAARLNERHIAYLDSPVSGGTIGADNGTLAIMVGGKASSFERAQPVFHVFGKSDPRGPYWNGPTQQAGQPNDRGRDDRHRGRGLALVRTWRRPYGQGEESHYLRLCR